ncbi:MAG: hypothetical protein COZ67_03210, partial [Chloroflexi bacterium CG_4_8_14_3_um_filter_45_15]
IEILVPYFKAGLENNEFCMWITSEPLQVEEAKAALKKAVINPDDYIKKGQIEILDYSEWYTRAGKFDADEVLQGWVDKEKLALEKGLDGLRLTGNTFWLEPKDWKDFYDYEAMVDRVIGQYHMLAICTYSLELCGINDVLDVVSNHQFAILRRAGEWEIIVSAGRKRSIDALKKAEQNFHSSLDESPLGIRIVSAEGELLYANQAILDIYGYSSLEELAAVPTKQRYTPESYAEHQKRKEKRKRGEFVPSNYEISIVRKDGEVRHLNVFRREVIWNGETQFQVLHEDITERKRAEEALRESREKYKELVDFLPQTVFEIDETGNFVFANRHGLETSGNTQQDIDKGLNALQLFIPEDRNRVRENMRRILAGERLGGTEYTAMRKDGSTFPALVYSVPITRGGKPAGLRGLVIDITERERAEEALRESEERYRTLFDSSLDGIAFHNMEGRILDANQAYLDMLGYTMGEIKKLIYLQLTPKKWYKTEARIVEDEITERGYSDEYEKEYIRKDGTVFPVSLRRWLIRDEKGKPVGIWGITRDITEHKQLQDEKAEWERKAHVASRLASIGQMAAGVAHEINNPLTAVIGYARLLQTKKDIPGDIRQDIDIIHEEAQRVANIVRKLLAFARQQKPERKLVNINDTISTTLDLRAYSLKTNNIEVTTQLDPDLPMTLADASQLQQVFLNIILNAETEMKLAHGKGKFLVKTAQVNNNIRISFEDNGPGIAEENLDRIFEPFFTTREVGQGTGLGLSLCHGIVAEHGGRIYAQSKLGKGATFVVELPIIL